MTTVAKKLVQPFDLETAIAKARLGEDAWNSRDPDRVALANTEDSRGKELWAFGDRRISVRFQYEWHDDAGLESTRNRSVALHTQPSKHFVRT